MNPKNFANRLRQLATSIEKANHPSRAKVASHLKRMIVAMGPDDLPPGILDQTFHQVLNSNEHDPRSVVQAAADEINEACKRYPNSPRDAGVFDPATIAADPIRVDLVDLEDSDTGYVVISGGGLAAPISVPFSADETVADWMNYSLLEALPSS